MKTKLVLHDGLVELVIEPENKHEETMIKLFREKTFACQHKYRLQEETHHGIYLQYQKPNLSLVVREMDRYEIQEKKTFEDKNGAIEMGRHEIDKLKHAHNYWCS